jgi:hypothetical protein
MESYVTIETVDAFSGRGDVHRRLVKREVERVLSSGKVLEAEISPDFSEARFHVKYDRPSELFVLLGNVLTGTCKVVTTPVPRHATA